MSAGSWYRDLLGFGETNPIPEGGREDRDSAFASNGCGASRSYNWKPVAHSLFENRAPSAPPATEASESRRKKTNIMKKMTVANVAGFSRVRNAS